MTGAKRTRALAVALALLLAAGAALAHYALAFGHSPTLGAIVALVPLIAIAVLAMRRSKRRALPILAFAGATLLLWLGWDSLERHFSNVFFLEHVGTNLLLGAMFGRTLAGHREPLCTRFARLLHGPLSPEEARYSRQVTAAWTLFFLAMAALSTLLYLGGSVATWSIFANFLTLPLVVAMFAIEYAVRRRVLPAAQGASILDGALAFWRHSEAAPSEAPR